MLVWLRLLPLLLLLAQSNASASGDSNNTNVDSTNDNDSGADSDDTTDDTDDDATTDDDEDSDANANSSGKTVKGTTFERGFNNLLERFGNNPRRVAEHLYRQDYKHRENLRLARTENEQLRTQLPKNGARTVDKQTARDLEAYRKLGKPQELATLLANGRKAEQDLQARTKDDTIRDVAELTGWNYKALKGAASDVEYTIKEVDANGQKQRQAFVVTRNGDDTQPTEHPVTDWFTANRDFLLPALTANASASTTATQRNGQQFIQQPVNQQRNNGQGQPLSAAASVLSRYDEPKK